MTTITNGQTSSGSYSGSVTVNSGGILTSATILAGGSAVISSGGQMISTTIANGGKATVSGTDANSIIQLGGTESLVSSGTGAGATATGDQVYGSQVISAGTTASNETVFGGGVVIINSKAAVLAGGFTFSGEGGTLIDSDASTPSASQGELATISGFTAGDAIVLTSMTGAVTSSITSGSAAGPETLSVTNGTLTEAFTFANVPSLTVVTLASGDEVLANTTVLATGSDANQAITAGTGLFVSAGAATSGDTVNAGGALVVAGTDTGSTIGAGALETVFGSATGDQVYGSQYLSGATAYISNETVFNGGLISMTSKGEIATGITVQGGGTLSINGNILVSNTTISGGTVVLASTSANLTSGVTFAGSGGVISSVAMTKQPAGVTGVITGFGPGDEVIVADGGNAITITSAGSVVTAAYTAGTSLVSEAFTFASNALEAFAFTSTTGNAAMAAGTIAVAPTTNVTGAISGGTAVAGLTVNVSAGGSVTSATVASGGIMNILVGGADTATTIALGGTETVFGTATKDVIAGAVIISGTETSATIAAGGTQTVAAGGIASNDLIYGTEIVSGGKAANATINGGTLSVLSGTVTGNITFANSGTLSEATSFANAEMLSGFAAGDALVLSGLGAGVTMTSATVGGNEIITLAGGAGMSGPETFTFAGDTTSIFALGTASGADTVSTLPNIVTVSANVTSTGLHIAAGQQLNVLATGTDSYATIALGGSETVFGTTSNDLISGTAVISGTATGETVYNGGALTLASGASASNIVLSGGSVTDAGATLTGGITFATSGTLTETAIANNGAVISGFTNTDVIDLANIGSGNVIIGATTQGGDTVITIASGGTVVAGSSMGSATETLTFATTSEIFSLGTDGNGGETLSAVPLLTSFTAGDLVIGLVGDDNNSALYGDNDASPIVLEEVTTTGVIVGDMVLPQSSNGANYAISGEYGSSSEGILQLSGNGQQLVIAGYGVNAYTYNSAESAYTDTNTGGIYGTPALAQSTSLTDGTLVPVARVVADVSYNGAVNTSTAVFNIFNTNNPRSVTTVNGTTFYLSGQGAKDDTQGVFEVQNGSSVATAIDTTTDTRDAEIVNGNLYVSQNSSEGTGNIEEFNGLPTAAATPTILSGINMTVLLTSTNGNTVNGAEAGQQVDLSPEQYFFANATTLYVADGGQPKAGTIGDGGLQKWTLNTTTGAWTLDYTLSQGLNLVDNGNTGVSSNTDGTTGLIGLSGVLNANGTVTFYATNSTIADLDQTYVYTITDTVSATTAPTGESFSVVTSATAGENERGISLAPSAPVDTTVSAGSTNSGLTVSNGGIATVSAGGTLVNAVVLSGGTAFVYGTDTGSLIVEGGGEAVYGSATGDNVYGTQIISGSASYEGLYYDGAVTVAAGGSLTNVTMQVDSDLVISGSVNGVNAQGGIIAVASDSASLSGVTLGGSAEVALLTSGASITGVIYGSGADNVIDLTQMGTGATLTSAVVGSTVVATVTSGGISQAFTLGGSLAPNDLMLAADNGSGTLLELGNAGVTGTEDVASGAYGANITIDNGGYLQVDAGGTAAQSLILSGGTGTVFGITGNDVIDGSLALATGASAANEMVLGGTLSVASGASVTGSLVLANSATVDLANGASLSGAVISGFGLGDAIVLSGMASGTLATTSANGNTVETVTSGGVSESFTFSGPGYTLPGIFALTNGTLTANIVSAGQSESNLTVISGSPVEVLSGGALYAPTVAAGGTAVVFGTDTNAVVSSGGSLVLSSGGIDNGVTILTGGTETLVGPNTVSGGQVYGVQQVLNANSATGSTIGNETIGNGGTVELFYKDNTIQNSTILTGGTLAISGNATGTNLTVAGGTIILESPKANITGTLNLSGASTLDVTHVMSAGAGYTAVINGFNASDVIDLTAIGTGASLTSSTNGAGDTVVTIAGGSNMTATNETSETFTFATGGNFALTAVTGGDEITLLCFYPGTRIATPAGDVVVEALAAGDLVLTANGPKAVRWMGQSPVHLHFADKLRALPVRIAAGALGDGLPLRDLMVSPDHALYLHGVLVQASALVGLPGIARAQDVPEQFTYHHVELATHELLYAEGALAESFVDNVDRMHFANWDARTAPVEPVPEMDLPRVKSARQLPATLRATLAA